MPQQAWSAKRERQYDHIEESLEKRGTPKKKAKEIAARTVNKERAQHGEAKQSSRLSRRDMSPGPPRRAAFRHEPAEGPHEGAALQRGPPHGHRGPLEHEQGAAPAGGRQA